MTDQAKGIYAKFKVERTDGSSAPGGKHEECAYFVLDLEHDDFAIPALKAYARACRKRYPELAEDIDLIVSARPCGCRGVGDCFHFFSPQSPSEQAEDLMRRSAERGE